MLFNEPKLLKWCTFAVAVPYRRSFSALQRAEIAEMDARRLVEQLRYGFSALQRAEIAEIIRELPARKRAHDVSVLFNEPKLLKLCGSGVDRRKSGCFSALQRAEIAEIQPDRGAAVEVEEFQCSSTSRNC